MYIGLHLKYRHSCRMLIKLDFLHIFSEKKSLISNFVKIRPAGDEFFSHADGQMYMTKLIFVFRNFANAHKHPHFTHTLCLFDNYDSHT
jgi:hypothetical protein